jgi:hypothetical protein
MISLGKMNAKCNIRINRYNKPSSSIPKSSESFVWKDTNWKKIELRLNILQNKIYTARRNQNIRKVRKLQKSILNSYYFKKLSVRKVIQKKKKIILHSSVKRNSFPSIV